MKKLSVLIVFAIFIPLLATPISTDREFNQYLLQLKKLGKANRSELVNLGKQYEEKWGLKILNLGTMFFREFHRKMWGIAFIDKRKMTIEQARPMAEDMARGYIDSIQKNPSFRGYCAVNHCDWVLKEISFDKKEELAKIFAFKIAFWDENYDRPTYPYVADIRFIDGALEYSYANPETQELEKTIEEKVSFAEN